MPTVSQLKGKLKFYTKPYGRQWKWRYQVHGGFVEPSVIIPDGLKKKEIIDPLHPVKIEQPKWVPPRRHPLLEQFFPKPRPEDHPNYHKKPAMVYNQTLKLTAGIDQACLLTKTMAIEGLPDILKSNCAKYTVPNEVSHFFISFYLSKLLLGHP
jgi:hypothetical protein